MKRLLMTLMAALVALVAWAQTPVEILAKMSEAMDEKENGGMAMTMDMKIPIMGTMSMRMYTLGKKSKMETTLKGHLVTMWDDGEIIRTYNGEDNRITMEDSTPGGDSEADENLGLAKSVTEGYDVKLVKETADAWYFACKKQKTNKEKDDPKNIELSVWKDSYCLREMNTSMKGVKLTLRDVTYNITEDDVTFDESRFPDAEVVDKRKHE